MKCGKNKPFVLTLASVFSLMTACTSQPALQANQNQAIVNRFIAAFNQHDVAAMLMETTEAITWYAVDEESINTQTYGQAQLQRAMERYFAAVPSVHSSLESISANGNLVNTIEKATWQNRGQTQQQCSRAVYELSDNKINKVWYFPAEEC